MKKVVIGLMVGLMSIGMVLAQDIKDDPAQVAFDAAKVLFTAKDYIKAQAAFEKVIKDYPNASGKILANAQMHIGHSLYRQGKYVEAQAAFMACVQNYVWELGAEHEEGVIWSAFNLVNPKLISTADYKAFLENTIKATKATEENAKFLGRLKSELEKIK